MPYTSEEWAVKREKGLGRFLLLDGVLFTGGPFAVVMQIAGFFLTWGEYETFGTYFTASRTWVTFLLHGTLFGLIIGYIKWRRNERANPPTTNAGDGV